MSTSGLGPIRQKPASLTDMVFERIRDAIVNRTIAPGSVVTENSLAGSLQVSKTPVRESLIRLRAIGLLQIDGRRLRVVVTSEKTLRDSYELRLALETAAAQRAAERASRADGVQLVDIAARSLDLARAGDSASYSEASRDLHLRIARVADNVLIYERVNDSLVLTNALWQRDVPTGKDGERRLASAEGHLRIAKAIAGKDPQAAAASMSDHILELLLDRTSAHRSDAPRS